MENGIIRNHVEEHVRRSGILKDNWDIRDGESILSKMRN